VPKKSSRCSLRAARRSNNNSSSSNNLLRHQHYLSDLWRAGLFLTLHPRLQQRQKIRMKSLIIACPVLGSHAQTRHFLRLESPSNFFKATHRFHWMSRKLPKLGPIYSVAKPIPLVKSLPLFPQSYALLLSITSPPPPTRSEIHAQSSTLSLFP